MRVVRIGNIATVLVGPKEGKKGRIVELFRVMGDWMCGIRFGEETWFYFLDTEVTDGETRIQLPGSTNAVETTGGQYCRGLTTIPE